jgi:tripartite-type tricarboxylate transporter receptor subunit TctC
MNHRPSLSKCLRRSLAVILAALAPHLALAQAYPAKPIRVIVPFPPGGSVDTVARLLSPRLGESLGQQLVIENRSGASGNIGMEQAARAAPDGYTLLVNTNPLVTNGLLYTKLNYDTFTDFAPISLLCQSPSVMAINPRVPARNLQEFLDLARSKPGTLNLATAGPATNPHVGGELVNYLGKTNIVAIHFKGGGPALLATIAGDTEMVVSGISEVGPQVAAGKLRAMGVTGLKRSPAYPDIPTLDESGLPGYEFLTWHAILAPKGTPAAVVETLSDRVRKVMLSPEGAALFQKNGLEVIASTPEELTAHLKSEAAKWQRVFKERGMRAD